MILTSGTPSRLAWEMKLQLPLLVVQERRVVESIMQWKLTMILTKTSHQGKTQASGSTYQTSIT